MATPNKLQNPTTLDQVSLYELLNGHTLAGFAIGAAPLYGYNGYPSFKNIKPKIFLHTVPFGNGLEKKNVTA